MDTTTVQLRRKYHPPGSHKARTSPSNAPKATTANRNNSAHRSSNPACRQPTTQEIPQNVNRKAHEATMATRKHINNLCSCHIVTMVTTRTHRQTPCDTPPPPPEAKDHQDTKPKPPDPNEQSHHSPLSPLWQHAVGPTNVPQPPSRQHPPPRHTILCKCNAPPNPLTTQAASQNLRKLRKRSKLT